MMKFIAILLVAMFAFNAPVMAEETTEDEAIVEEVEEEEENTLYENARIVLAIAGSIGFGSMTLLSLSARKTIKKVGTLAFLTDLLLRAISKFGDLDEKTQKKVDDGIKALASLPFIKGWFDKADTILEQRLLDLDDKIVDWRIKINSGVLEGIDLENAKKQLEALIAKKKELQIELNSDEENSS